MLPRSRILPDSVIAFLREKIIELGSALFFNQSEAVLRFPTSLISALHVDEIGQVWFFISKPPQQIQEFEKDFQVKMNFFKKGKSFYLNLQGRAFVVTDPEEVNQMAFPGLVHRLPDQLSANQVLMKVRIADFNYFDSRKKINTYQHA